MWMVWNVLQALSNCLRLIQLFQDEMNCAIAAISSISLSSTTSDLILTCPQVNGGEWLLIWGGEAGHNLNGSDCWCLVEILRAVGCKGRISRLSHYHGTSGLAKTRGESVDTTVVLIVNPCTATPNMFPTARHSHQISESPTHTPLSDERCKPDTPSNSPLPSSTSGNLQWLHNWSAPPEENLKPLPESQLPTLLASESHPPPPKTNVWAQRINSMRLKYVMTWIDYGCRDSLNTNHIE
jgi:hypothetical protein